MYVESARGVCTEFEVLGQNSPERLNSGHPIRIGQDDGCDNFHWI